MATKPKALPGQREKDLEAPELVAKYWRKFFEAHPIDAERHGREAMEWFKTKVSKDLKADARKMIQNSKDYGAFTQADRSMIGKLYLFEYEAVSAGDAEAGVYDRFPTTFFFNVSRTKQGHTLIHGINMHYLTPKQRGIVYMGLMKLKTSKQWSPKVKLRLQWELIKQVTSEPLAEKAVHAYRLDRFKSKLVEIPSNDWIIAAFLRTERWIPVDKDDLPYQSDLRRRIMNNKL